jgi:hypothetical protein
MVTTSRDLYSRKILFLIIASYLLISQESLIAQEINNQYIINGPIYIHHKATMLCTKGFDVYTFFLSAREAAINKDVSFNNIILKTNYGDITCDGPLSSISADILTDCFMYIRNDSCDSKLKLKSLKILSATGKYRGQTVNLIDKIEYFDFRPIKIIIQKRK